MFIILIVVTVSHVYIFQNLPIAHLHGCSYLHQLYLNKAVFKNSVKQIANFFKDEQNIWTDTSPVKICKWSSKRCHFTLSRCLKTARVEEDAEQLELCYIVVGNAKWCHFGKVRQFLIKLNILTVIPSTLFLRYLLKGNEILCFMKTCTYMFL